MSKALSFYTRYGCHLCEEMHHELLQHQERYGYSFEVIDVDSSPELQEKYNVKVPFLGCGDEEICHHFLDLDALHEYFTRH